MKRAIKSLLLRLGVEIHRRKPYGTDIFRDIHSIVENKRPLIAFDVGANVGQTALALELEFPGATIHSFEPNPETYQQLKNNVNGHSAITCHQVALGRRSEDRQMHLTKSSLTSSLLPVSSEAAQFLGDLVDNAGQAKVAVSSLDEFVAKNKIAHLDLLKLDVQGFEVEMLSGATESLKNDKISTVFTEVNFVSLYQNQAYFQDVYAEMIRHGYQLVGLYHSDYRAGPYIAWSDALFMKPAAVARGARLSQ